MYNESYTEPSIRVCNVIDNRCYHVSSKYSNSTHVTASAYLAHLNIFSIKLIRHLRNNCLWGDCDPYKQHIIKYLLQNYNPNNIIENAPDSNVNTSYVKNKGSVFAICLREKISGNNNFLPMHMLEFVVMHEMAHLASYGFGHGAEFWTNFKILLTEAYKIGLHKPIDYKKTPIVYCSLRVDYNPFFDTRIII